MVRYDIYLLQFGFHPMAVILTQEQQYTRGETNHHRTHKLVSKTHKTIKKDNKQQ